METQVQHQQPLVVNISAFEGPLDLLIFLIKKNEINIYDIPMAELTEQYLNYINKWKELDVEVASEYLVMAATLLYIKSRMLLPRPKLEDGNEQEVDPREKFVQSLLEYERYKKAAEFLEQRPLMGRDVFTSILPKLIMTEGESEETQVGLFDLALAFQDLLDRAKNKPQMIAPDEYRVEDCIEKCLQKLSFRSQCSLEELLDDGAVAEIVVTFLALLELARTQVIRVIQMRTFSSIGIELLRPLVTEENRG